MANLADQWETLLSELRRETHKAGIPTESFQQMAKYGYEWVSVHEFGSRALSLWSYRQNADGALRLVQQRQQAIADLARCMTPVFTDGQLNCLAALHPFGFEARAFGVAAGSHLEAMQRLVAITLEEFWSEFPCPQEEGESILPQLSEDKPEFVLARFVARYGDIMERWPSWRNELRVEYDANFNPTFISDWDVEVRPESTQSRAANDPKTIVYLGDRNYRFPNGSEVLVSNGEHDILQAFIGCSAMDTKMLQSKSDAPNADATIRQMSRQEKYQGLIHRPGAKGKGGFRISVISQAKEAIPQR